MVSNRTRRTATIAIVCSVVALLAATWAIVNHNRVSSLQGEVQQLKADITTLRENVTASAYTFVPTDIAPPNVQGVAYIGASGSGVVVTSNLPPAGDDEVYRLWLLPDTEDAAIAAGTLITTPQGQGFALLPADTSGYSRIAVSLESQGSESPIGAYMLIADVNAARGWHPEPRAVCQNLSIRAQARAL